MWGSTGVRLLAGVSMLMLTAVVREAVAIALAAWVCLVTKPAEVFIAAVTGAPVKLILEAVAF